MFFCKLEFLINFYTVLVFSNTKLIVLVNVSCAPPPRIFGLCPPMLVSKVSIQFDYQLVLPFDFLTFNKIFAVDYATINMIVELSTICFLLITRQCHWMLTFNALIVAHSTALSDIQRWTSDNKSIDNWLTLNTT